MWIDEMFKKNLEKVPGVAVSPAKAIAFCALFHERRNVVERFLDIYLGAIPDVNANPLEDIPYKLRANFSKHKNDQYAGSGENEAAEKFTRALFTFIHGPKKKLPPTPWSFAV